MSLDDLDDRLDESLSSINSPNHEPNRDEDQFSVDAILTKEYGLEQPKPSLPDISDTLTKTVMIWLHETPKREKIKELFNDTLMPKNVEGLTPVKINEALYQQLSFRAKLNDQRLQGINTYFTRGIGPILLVLEQILMMEVQLVSRKSVTSQDGKLLYDKMVVDLTELRCTLSSGLRILSCGPVVTLQTRKPGGFMQRCVFPCIVKFLVHLLQYLKDTINIIPQTTTKYVVLYENWVTQI